jgi:RND family efflux transporter MFP subunit
MKERETEAIRPPTLTRRRRRLPRFSRLTVVVIVLLVIGIGFWRLLSKPGSAQPPNLTESKTVAVVKVVRNTLKTDSTLQAEFIPYQDILIHAKVSGYVSMIRVDIGDRVKQGELLATLEVPELQDNINKAKAGLSATEQEIARAQANYDNMHQIYERLHEVVKAHPNLIAQQDVDTAMSKEEAALGALGDSEQHRQEAQAELGRLNTLAGYEKITAPFDGIITKRFADLGSLIQMGTSSNTQTLPLVELAQDDLLRLRFPVPEAQTPFIENGLQVQVTIPTLNKTFVGKIVRSAWDISRSTRTMTTEVDVKNPDGRIKAGMYAAVKLPLTQAKNVLVVPLQALSSGDNPSVFVSSKDGKLQERLVKTGLRTATEAEVTDGLSEGDLVVVGNRSGLIAGEKAEPKLVALPEITEEG